MAGSSAQSAEKENEVLARFDDLLYSLNDYGINLRGAIINESAGNPIGGVRQGQTNVGQAQLGADFNLGRIIGLDGGFVHVTGFRDYGKSLSLQTLGLGYKVQEIYRNPYNQLHFGQFTYEQLLLDNKLSVEIGRTAIARYYGHGDQVCRFVSGTNCGIPALLNSQSGYTLLPSATWGGNIVYKFTPQLSLMTGAFEVDPAAAPSDGWNWSTKHATGVTIPVELTLGTNFQNDPYPFNAKLGGYWSNGGHPDPYFNSKGQSVALRGGAPANIDERSGMYLLTSKVLWRDEVDPRHNISLLTAYVQPFNNSEVYAREASLGMVWNGPAADRPDDWAGLMVTYFRISDLRADFLNETRFKLGGRGRTPQNEFAIELNYGVHLFKGATITPSIQYIVNPDNTAIPRITFVPKNALILGLRAEYKFGDPPFAGLERLGDRRP